MRILVADDHAVVRSGLKTILGTREGWEICAEAETGEEAVALAMRYRPDVVIYETGSLRDATVLQGNPPS